MKSAKRKKQVRPTIQASLPEFVLAEFNAQRAARAFDYFGGESQLISDMIYLISTNDDFKRRYELWAEVKGRVPGCGRKFS